MRRVNQNCWALRSESFNDSEPGVLMKTSRPYKLEAAFDSLSSQPLMNGTDLEGCSCRARRSAARLPA